MSERARDKEANVTTLYNASFFDLTAFNNDLSMEFAEEAQPKAHPFKDNSGTVYQTVSEAARILNISSTHIREVLNGKRLYAGGMKFTYIDTPGIKLGSIFKSAAYELTGLNSNGELSIPHYKDWPDLPGYTKRPSSTYDYSEFEEGILYNTFVGDYLITHTYSTRTQLTKRPMGQGNRFSYNFLINNTLYGIVAPSTSAYKDGAVHFGYQSKDQEEDAFNRMCVDMKRHFKQVLFEINAALIHQSDPKFQDYIMKLETYQMNGHELKDPKAPDEEPIKEEPEQDIEDAEIIVEANMRIVANDPKYSNSKEYLEEGNEFLIINEAMERAGFKLHGRVDDDLLTYITKDNMYGIVGPKITAHIWPSNNNIIDEYSSVKVTLIIDKNGPSEFVIYDSEVMTQAFNKFMLSMQNMIMDIYKKRFGIEVVNKSIMDAKKKHIIDMLRSKNKPEDLSRVKTLPDIQYTEEMPSEYQLDIGVSDFDKESVALPNSGAIDEDKYEDGDESRQDSSIPQGRF